MSEPLPTTLGVCPVCWGEFSVPDAKPGDTCPVGPHEFHEDTPLYNPPLVIYEEGGGVSDEFTVHARMLRSRAMTELYRLEQLRERVDEIAAYAWKHADINTADGQTIGMIANDLACALQRSRGEEGL